MFRTRPAGVTMIVVAALVSTSTAYLLATRAIEQTAPIDVEPAAALPGTGFTEHEMAIQATLLCLAAAGMMPTAEPTRGKTVTRITVDGQSLDPDTADAIVADCREASNLDEIEADQRARLLRTAPPGPDDPGAVRQECLVSRSSGRTFCFDDLVIATGLQPLATH